MNYDWKNFVNQPVDPRWINKDDLTLAQLNKIIKLCKGCRVTIREMTEIVQDISMEFLLSPKDSLEMFKTIGRDGKIS